MSRDPSRAALQFFGGRVCLDFANTLDWRFTDDPQELIPSYAAFLQWSGRRATMPKRAIEKLRARSAREPGPAQEAIGQTYSLRTDLWAIAEALLRGGSADLTSFNRRLSAMPAQPKLIPQGKGFVHDLKGRDWDEPLWPILWSVAAVLASNDANRIGQCQASGCGWLFVDESPNRSRLWCSSEVCGNRERARRAYAKRRVSIPAR
jgi:predicted RNA-binding Zn ribbon-like protein